MSPKDAANPKAKQRIILSAIQLFAENGYYKTTSTNIASAAGVSQPYLYHFFKNKEELYLAVLEQAEKRVIQAFREKIVSADKLKEAMGDAFKHLLEEHRDEILLAMTAHTISEPAIRETVRDAFDRVHDTLYELFEQAGFADPGQEANVFIGEGLLIALAETINMPKLMPKFS